MATQVCRQPFCSASSRPRALCRSARRQPTQSCVLSCKQQTSHTVRTASVSRISSVMQSVSAASMLLCGAANATELSLPVTTPLMDLAAIDGSTAALAAAFLRPTFAIGILLYVVRIVMSWYPQIDGSKLPWAIVYLPTELPLKLTRKVIPLVGGVDITPIIWVALLSFFNEILLGPQGILNLIERQGSL